MDAYGTCNDLADMSAPSRYRHVKNLWTDVKAPSDPVDQLVHRSRLLGSDLSITNFGGGNTSVKLEGQDRVTGAPIQQLWVKGSGGDLGSLGRSGLAVLDLNRVRALERTFRGVEFEDEQVALLQDCLLEPRAAAPSIDTPLHGLLPFTHVDHVHPDAVIAFATAEDGAGFAEEVFGGDLAWLDWQRPGFDLALKLKRLIEERPHVRGVVLGGHGLITWGNSSEECYRNTLDVIERAADHLDQIASRGGTAFGGRVITALDKADRKRQAASILPLLRGLAGSGERHLIGHFRDDETVLDFVCSKDGARLVELGTSCPDHFLRTKQRPLLLDLEAVGDPLADRSRIESAFQAYRDRYRSYYSAHAGADSPAMRNPNPVVVLWPGVGMFTFARSKREARIAGEFYVNAINVMRGAERLSSYQGLADSEAFQIEYWSLEEAKLRRMPPESPLQGRVALVTGASGGIGRAIARRLAAEGAAVVLTDIDPAGLEELSREFGEQGVAVPLDVTDEKSVVSSTEQAVLQFGGLDIAVNNAGISRSTPIVEATVEDVESLHAVIVRGSFLITRALARLTVSQRLPADIVYICSKNAVFAGVDNLAYGSAKAAQLHQMRLAAAELAPLGIRVNGVNPDAVIRDSKIFAGEWGENRAAAYGIERDRLGEFYAQRSLLKREVLPEDIASACFVLVAGALGKTTGHVIPVDGGIPAAFLR